MNVGLRLTAWIGAGAVLSAATASSFPSLVSQSTGDDFGALFVAIPIVALLTLIFALRWREFVKAIEAEMKNEPVVRVLGLAMIGLLLAVKPFTSQSLAASGVAVVLTFYGAALAVIPASGRFILPYAAVYAAAAGAPAVLLWAFGEPLAGVSSALSAKMAALAGFPLTWQGTQFAFISKTGEVVSGSVTPGCSSISSVTIFIGLLALMQLDLKKDIRSTLKLAGVGVLALMLLNSLRILILLWVGYEYGSSALWGLHDWLGYAIFLGFFLAILPVYARMKGPMERTAGAPGTTWPSSDQEPRL